MTKAICLSAVFAACLFPPPFAWTLGEETCWKEPPPFGIVQIMEPDYPSLECTHSLVHPQLQSDLEWDGQPCIADRSGNFSDECLSAHRRNKASREDCVKP